MPDWDTLDAEIARRGEAGFELIERLVAAGGLRHDEHRVGAVLATALADAGFDVRRIPIPQDIADLPPAGIPDGSYDGRTDVLGLRGEALPGPSLLLNGHLDVVPVEAPLWSTAPFTPTRRDGWLYGRGAGDMKGGFAVGLLAIAALDAVAPGWQRGPLRVLGVIEEECTGNGTLAACQAGALADGVLLLEPTGLDILLGGVGILWADVSVRGEAAHAESADRAANPVAVLPALLEELGGLESEMADIDDEALTGIAHPYNVNVGLVSAGSWRSSVPGVLQVGVRIGHPRSWTAAATLDRVAGCADRAAKAAGIDPGRVTVAPSGLRAEGHALAPDHPLVGMLAAAHRDAHGADPGRVTSGSTTDARFYLNQFCIPAVAYGARTRNMHGNDEAVELASVLAAARTVARFLHTYYATDQPLPRPR